MDASTLNIYVSSKYLWEEMELLNRKNKKGVDIFSDIYYHLFLSFEWRLNNGLEGSKCMCRIRWRGKVRVMIESLVMRGGV